LHFIDFYLIVTTFFLLSIYRCNIYFHDYHPQVSAAKCRICKRDIEHRYRVNTTRMPH